MKGFNNVLDRSLWKQLVHFTFLIIILESAVLLTVSQISLAADSNGWNKDGETVSLSNPADKVVAGFTDFNLKGGQISISTPGAWPGIIAFDHEARHRRDIIFDRWGMKLVTSNSASPPDPNNGIEILESGLVKVKTLEILGGADLSEEFKINSNISSSLPLPGMIVSIDPESPGELEVSHQQYDRKVAGIISGAGDIKAGMVMGKDVAKSRDASPVALSGRVYCLADASKGKIQAGDLLTTSDLPGHAMKVMDYPRAQGAIIGKAMNALKEGQGLVLVLVNLQ